MYKAYWKGLNMHLIYDDFLEKNFKKLHTGVYVMGAEYIVWVTLQSAK